MPSLHRAMVTDGELKLGYNCVILINQGVKVGGTGTYYCDLLLSQQLVPVICEVSGKFIFQQYSDVAYSSC